MKNRLFIVLISLFCLFPFRGYSKHSVTCYSKDPIADPNLSITITTTSSACNYNTGTITFTPNQPIPPNVIYDVMYQGVLTSVKVPSLNGAVVFTNLAAGTYIVGYRDSEPGSGFNFSPLTNYTIVIQAGSDVVNPTGVIAQTFCKATNATVASLVTNQKGVIWYGAAIGGNVIPSATALTNGSTYYGTLKEGTCESSTRLAVTVTIGDLKPPTAVASQEFLKSDNPTVANLVTLEPEVIWYDKVTGGNVVLTTTALENNKIYYGGLKAGTCESSKRIAVTVNIKDFKTPATSKKIQEEVSTLHASDYFTLYPNPASNILSVYVTQGLEIQSLVIYNVLGQSVIEIPNAKSVSNIDISKLTGGNYFLNVQTNKGNSSRQFVKY